MTKEQLENIIKFETYATTCDNVGGIDDAVDKIYNHLLTESFKKNQEDKKYTNMFKGVFLPIFHHTDESIEKRDAGLDWKYEECRLEKIKFYSIVAISPLYEREVNTGYTEIHANGEVFICSLKPEEVDKKIISLF